MLEIAIILASVITNLFIGLSAFKKDPRSITNIVVALLCASWVIWVILTYTSLHYDFMRLEIVRLTMVFVMLMLGLFFFLMRVFPKRKHTFTKIDWYALGFTAFATVVGISPFLFERLLISSEGGVTPVPGPGIPVFMIYAITFTISSLVILVKKMRKSRGVEREQLRLIAMGAAVFFTIMPLTNFILPVIFSRSELVILSPIAPAIFGACIGYAIIKHRLMDIRAFVVRAVVYIFMLILLGATYAALVINTGFSFLQHNGLEEYEEIYYVAATLLVASSFRPLRLMVDRVTNRIFFQDSYDTKSVLDKISTLLVRGTSPDALARQSMMILQQALKVKHIGLVIKELDQDDTWRAIGVGNELPNMRGLARLAERQKFSIVSIEEIDNVHSEFSKALHATDTSHVVRLETSKEIIGYMFFGYKVSGNAFTKQDIELIKIASEELAVAEQNALRFEKIETFNERLQDEIHNATSELRLSNRKLQRLDESKDEFISMASHQLRTPLTSIKGYISMVLDGDMGDISPQQRKVLEEAFASSQRMVYLIGDFLNVSRIQTGKFMLEKSQVQLAHIIKDEIEQLKTTASARNITLAYDAPENFPVLELDENKMRQVMMNFIDNAIYYSPPNTTITVSIVKHAHDVSFKVEDQGIGVPKSEQHQLFTKFYRASNARKQRPDGTGIGLFMAKKVIVAHGGSIIFGTKEGKGSTFGFRLPLRATSVTEPARIEATQLQP